jgi:ribosomal protein S27AE
MEPYRPSLRRRLASARKLLGTLLAMFKPRREEVRLQRVCPLCGLITPRAKRVCLECGESLSAVSLERIEAKQG